MSSSFLFGIRRWFHDSSAQQNWPGNDLKLRKIGELVRKKTSHSSLHRRQHLQILLGQRSEVNRNQYCQQSKVARKQVWQSSAFVSPTKTLNTDLAPICDDTEPTGVPLEECRNGKR